MVPPVTITFCRAMRPIRWFWMKDTRSRVSRHAEQNLGFMGITVLDRVVEDAESAHQRQ